MSDLPIKVLIVDDSALVRTVLGRIFADSGDVEVVGSAASGQEALTLIDKTDPAVVCTDLHMPGMDGLQLTQRIMAETPRPILVISNVVDDQHTDNVFALLSAGAVDVFPKPKSGATGEYVEAAKELVRKVRVLAGVRVLRKTPSVTAPAKRPADSPAPVPSMPVVSPTPATPKPTSIVVVGASTGGPQAYRTIFSNLPADFPLPLLCVQHIGEGFLRGLIAWLNAESNLRVKIAEHGERAAAGTAYFAPDGRHLEVDSSCRLLTSVSKPLGGHRPSITHLFQSAAENFGGTAVGVLLTGMGRDGADGLLDISDAGGSTVAQDEASCIVFGMPQRAIELKAARRVVPLDQIATKLGQICARPAVPAR